MSTSLHAVKAYNNLIPKLRGGAFDDRIDTVSTSRRTLSSKRSCRFDSNKNSLTSRDLLSDNSTLRTIRNHSSFAGAHGYSHSTIKTEIDEEYHQKYQQNQNELELLKYNFGMLDEKNQVMGNRVQDLEEENKNLTAKYYKIKSNYLLIKDHYNANKLVIKNLEKEISNYLQQTKDLKAELDKTINEKITIENRNFELRTKVQALSQCQHEENKYFSNLEQDYKIQIQKLERDNIQKFQQIQDYQEKFAAGLEDLVQKRDEVFLEKTSFIQQLRELQDKLTRSLEENLQFKNEIIEQKQTIHALEKDNDVLASKLTVLTENYESYIHREPSHREIRTSVMLQDWNTRQSIESEEITKKYQKQQEALEQEMIELRNDKDCLTRAIDSIQEELLDSRTLFNKEKKQYEQEIEFLKQVISKNEKSYQDEINDLNNQIQSMNQEKSQLENESNKVRFDFNYLENRMTQLQDTIYKLESRNEKLEKELETAREHNKDLITQNIKSQYETLLQDKNQEITHFKLKDKENSQKIKELENLLEESKLQRETEIRNQLSYSHSYSDISDTEIRQPQLHQEKKSSPLKNRYYENYQIASARVYSSRHDEDTTRPVLTSLNSDIQKITSRYNDIKYKYDSVKNQTHHH